MTRSITRDFISRLAQAYRQLIRPLPRCYWCKRSFSLMSQGVADADRIFCFECYRHYVLCEGHLMTRRQA